MLKVVTWNVNSISMRLERLLAFLKRWNPDVVMLQELKCLKEKFPFEPILQAGYEAAVLGQKTYNGVAILSKTPIHNIETGMDPFFEDPAARIIRAKIRGITFICCYVPNGQEVGSEKFAYKLQWLSGLSKLLAQSQIQLSPMIIAGDFNIAPEDRDVHDPILWKDKILCSQQERETFDRILKMGFQDTFRIHHPEDGLFSWWDYRALGFQKNHGLRIDFVLASSSLASACSNTWIDREERKGEKPSDHAPVIAEFKISLPPF